MAVLFEFQKSQLVRCADDTAGILTGALLGLYQAPIDINQSNVLATFTAAVATYNTYAAQVIVWGTPSVAIDGTVESVGAQLIFRPTDAVTPNSIWGVYITDTSGAILLFAGQFDEAPVNLNGTLDQLAINVRYRPATNSFVVTVD
jgi:hypothetical protein